MIILLSLLVGWWVFQLLAVIGALVTLWQCYRTVKRLVRWTLRVVRALQRDFRSLRDLLREHQAGRVAETVGNVASVKDKEVSATSGMANKAVETFGATNLVQNGAPRTVEED